MKTTYLFIVLIGLLFFAGCQTKKELSVLEFYGNGYGNSILHAKENQIPVFFKDQGTYDSGPLKDISYYISGHILNDTQSGFVEKKLFFRNYKPGSLIETITTGQTQYTYMSGYFYYFTFPKLGIQISLEDATSSYFNPQSPYFSERNLFYKYNKISLFDPLSPLFLYIFPKNTKSPFKKTIQQDHKFFFDKGYKIISPKEMTGRNNCRNSLISSGEMEIWILQPKSWNTLEDTELLGRIGNIDLIFILDKNHPEKYYMTSFINSLTCNGEIKINFFTL